MEKTITFENDSNLLIGASINDNGRYAKDLKNMLLKNRCNVYTVEWSKMHDNCYMFEMTPNVMWMDDWNDDDLSEHVDCRFVINNKNSADELKKIWTYICDMARCLGVEV